MYEEHASKSPYTQFVWRAKVAKSGSFTDAAHDFWVLVFRTRPGHTEIILTGPMTQPEIITYQAGQINWGIVFKAHVFIPALTKKTMLNARTVLPTDKNSFYIGEHKLQIPTYETAEEFVGDLVERGLLTANPLVAKALEGEPPAMSSRTLQRHYVKSVGLTQGRVQQIQRARHAFVLLEQGETIADAAAEAGYADQAHMTRSLKLLAGQTPGQIIHDYLSV